MIGPLTPRALRFLALHAAEPAPHRWAWRNVVWKRDGDHDFSKARLTAARFTGEFTPAGRRVQKEAKASPEDMEALSPYLGDLFTVNEAGRAILRAEGLLT